MTMIRRIVMLVLVGASMWASGCKMSPEVMREKAEHAWQWNDKAKAKHWYNQLSDVNPGAWDAHYYMGLLLLDESDYYAARSHLEIAYTLTRDMPIEVEDVADALAEAIYRQKQYRKLFGFLDEVIDAYGHSRDYMRKGSYLFQVGDHDAAYIAYKQGLKMVKPNDPTPFLAMADFYTKIGDTERAIIELRRAYTIDTDDKVIQQKLRDLGIIPGPTLLLPLEQPSP